jgi:hypothetical protein
MEMYLPGEGIDRYYAVMGYKSIEDQINAEVTKYVRLCEKASNHTSAEAEFKGMAHRVFYHILELRTTHKPSPLTWSDSQIPISQ